MLGLAGPLVGANLLQMAVYSVDVVFIARLGELPLAASSLGVSLYGLMLWVTTAFVGASAPLIAAELGRHRHSVREVRRTVRMTMWLTVPIALAVTLICHFGEEIMLATGQQAEVARQSGAFLTVLKYAAWPALASAVLRIFVAAMGRATIATAVMVLALIANALGNWLLIYGHWGLPAMGLRGSALSSALTTVVTLLAYVAIVLTDRRFRRFALFGRWWVSEWSRARELVRIGLPIAATTLAEGALFSGAAFLMGNLGPTELAAHTVALQLAALAFQVPFGVAQAATIRVGYHFGSGDTPAIARAGRAALIIGIGFMSFTALLMLFTPRTILRLYIDPDLVGNAAMVRLAVQYLAIAAAFQLLDGAQAVGAGLLRGLQDTRVPMWIAIFGYWVPGMLTSVGLGFFTPLRGVGIWIGLAVGLGVVSVLLLLRWSNRARLRLVVAPA